jgi:hypothetical protein
MKMSLVIFLSLLRLEFIPYSKIVYDYTFAAGAREDKVSSLKPTLFPGLV